MKAMCWSTTVLVCILVSTAAGQPEKIVRFPSEVSLGYVYIGELLPSDQHTWESWQSVGPARGEVRVPKDKVLRLDVSKTGSAHLAKLKLLNPGDVQVIYLTDFDVTDKHLAQFIGLEGVKALWCYSPSVGDAGLKHISKLTSLISLDVSRGCFTDEGLKHLANLKALQRLDLDRTEITDAGLTNLRELPSLRRISVDHCERISDTGIAHLAQIKSLDQLVMYGVKITGSCFSHFDPDNSLREVLVNHSTITDESLAHLAKIRSLEKLWIYNTKISNEGVMHLRNSSSLCELSIGQTSVSDIGVAALGKITSLESLDLSPWNTDAVLKDLIGLKRLKELDIRDIKLTGAGLGQLREFRELENLSLPPAPEGIDFSFLKELPRLEELFIKRVNMTAEDMNSLSCASSLKRLETYKVGVEDHDYAALGRLTNLEGLYWWADSRSQEHAMGDGILKAIAGHRKLRTLFLSVPSPTSEGFELLSTLPSLRALRRIRISDAVKDGWRHLGRLAHLQELYLTADSIPPGALEQLRGMKSLEELTLTVSEAYTSVLLPLADLESLRTLRLSGFVFESDSIEHLKTLGTGLQSLRISGRSMVSEEQISQINEQVPNCQVIVQRTPRISIGALPPKPTPYPSLVGKKLPELRELGLDVDMTQAQATMRLVCFFDMNQRPSRNCMRQLSSRSQELKAKGIVVVAVQASKVDRDKLNDWARKTDISLPTGVIQGDEKKTRVAWGVNSLPWLILTDKRHVVTDEGFGLPELDERITTSGEK